MTEWKAKRFWKTASVEQRGDGYTVLLDSRLVRTPGKSDLLLPSQALASEIAAEWDAQDDVIDPLSMPMTRSANAAIDKVTHQHAEVAGLLAEYGDADLLCYRAVSPASLVARQNEIWNPLLDWAAAILDAPLVPVSGVIHSPQNPETISHLAQKVGEMDVFVLTAFHDLVGMSGSLIIGFAALEPDADLIALWNASRLDEIWQAEQWGADEQAQAVADCKKAEFLHAKRFHDLAVKKH